jgi:hypothetical protein
VSPLEFFTAAPGFLLRSVLLGLFAAGLAWHLNKCLGRLPGATPARLAPLVEEAAKTVPAALFAADIFSVHFVFGLAEGAWEFGSGRRNGFYAGLWAVVTHSVFGFITVFVLQTCGSLAPALAAACLSHAVWNHVVFRYLKTAPKTGAEE